MRQTRQKTHICSGTPSTHVESLQRLLVKGIVRLDFGGCSFDHFRKSQSYVEHVSRALLLRQDPSGAIWLAYYLRRWGYSHADKALKGTYAFSSDLYARYLPRLMAKQGKSGFDCFTLGLEYQRGNKTGRDLALSRQMLRRAIGMGFSMATHELIISTMVDDTVALAEKEMVFSRHRGRGAKESIQAREIFRLCSQRVEGASDPNTWMRQLLVAWKGDVYSTVGKQYLNLRAESCIKDYVAFMKARNNLTAEDYVTLAKVVESSRVVSMESKPFEFYRMAALLGHLEAAEWYVRLTPETDREGIERVIRQAFNSIPSRIDEAIREKFEDY